MSADAVEIEILYFAALRERMGISRESLALPVEAGHIAALRRWLEANRPALTGQLAKVRFAVGDDFAEESRVLRAGDVVALIPPVSGG
jgi:molybdopterin converting factor subunit 1